MRYLKLIALFALLLASCAKPRVVAPPNPRDFGPVVQDTAKKFVRRAITETPIVGIVLCPDNLDCADPHSLEILVAAALPWVEFLPQNVTVLRRSQELGIQVSFTYQGSRETVDLLKAHFGGDWPANFHGMSLVDEPNPSSCPVGGSCYSEMQSIVSYAQAQLPPLPTRMTLSAYAAHDPANRWSTYAEPYYRLVTEVGLDYFAHCWANDNFSIYPVLIQNTKNRVGAKPVIFYQEGGPIDNCNDTIPAAKLGEAIQASMSANPKAVVLFAVPGRWPFRGEQWCEDVKAADAIQPAPLDANADGKIDGQDYFLAREACNNALAERVRVAANLKFNFAPLITKGFTPVNP